MYSSHRGNIVIPPLVALMVYLRRWPKTYILSDPTQFMPSFQTVPSQEQSTAGRLGRAIHGFGFGFLAFVCTYVAIFVVIALYRLDYPWFVFEGGPLSNVGAMGGAYYLPGAAEMIGSHAVVLAVLEFIRSGTISSSGFGAVLPVVVLLPCIALLLAGAAMGYGRQLVSLQASTRLSAWLLPGYLLPLTVLSVGSYLVEFRRYNYRAAQDPIDGPVLVFSLSPSLVMIVIVYGIGLVLLFGTLGVILSDRFFVSDPRESAAD